MSYDDTALDIARRYGALDASVRLALIDFECLSPGKWPYVIEKLRSDHRHIIGNSFSGEPASSTAGTTSPRSTSGDNGATPGPADPHREAAE